MALFSKIVSQVRQSETIRISDLALSLKTEGHDIISLSAGEPDFETPSVVKKAAITAINEGKTKYTEVTGIPQLKSAVIKKLNEENCLTFSEREIIISNGGKQVLYNALSSILDPGDEVLIFTPYWASYPEMVKIFGSTAIEIKSKGADYRLPEINSLRKLTTEKTKCIILNSPNNPSGVVFNEQELKALGKFLIDNPKIWILSDEIYEHIIYDGKKHLSILNVEPSLKNRTLIINGVSKSHSMTGWRIGYGAGPIDLINKMRKVQSQSTSNASAISQWAAVTALKNCSSIIKKNNKTFEGRRDLIIKLLEKNSLLGVMRPDGAFYLLINIEKLINRYYEGKEVISSDISFSELLLLKHGVAVVPGSAFGVKNSIRISFASKEQDIIMACRRLNEFVDKVQLNQV